MPIVEAVGSSANGAGYTRDATHEIEAAMSKAILWCAEHGITNPDKIRAAQLEARRVVLAKSA